MACKLALGAAIVLVAAPGCGKTATGLDELPVTLETAQAAVDLFTTGSIYVPANCAATPALNCPNGAAANPAPINLTRDSVRITPGGTGVYDFSAWGTAVTPNDIPITILGSQCGLAINSTSGTATEIGISGTLIFTSQTVDGPINRIDITNVNLTGLEPADVALHGNATCQGTSFGLSYYLSTITNALDQSAALCGAPGAALFEVCPSQATASARRSGS